VGSNLESFSQFCVKNGGSYLGSNSIILSLLETIKLADKVYVVMCNSSINNFMQKAASVAEISTKVTCRWVLLFNHPVVQTIIFSYVILSTLI